MGCVGSSVAHKIVLKCKIQVRHWINTILPRMVIGRVNGQIMKTESLFGLPLVLLSSGYRFPQCLENM